MDAVKIYLLSTGAIVVIISLTSLILLFHSIRRHQSERDQNEPNSLAIIPAKCAVIFYFVSSVLFISMMAHFNGQDNNNFTGNDVFVIMSSLFVLSLISAKTSIYSKFLFRIYDTFRASVLELDRRIAIIGLCLISLLFITVVWWIILIFHRHIFLESDYPGYSEQFMAVFVLLLVFDCSISWLVVGLMINKLFKVKKTQFSKT